VGISNDLPVLPRSRFSFGAVQMRSLMAYALPNRAFEYGYLTRDDQETSIEICSFEGKVSSSSGFLPIIKDEFNSALNTVKLNVPENYPPDIQTYRDVLHRAIQNLHEGTLHKVVIARILRMPFHGDLALLLHGLERLPANTFRYLLISEQGIWCGATPETLLSFHETRVLAHALAGTLPTDKGAWSQKERLEQELVANTILASFLQAGVSQVAISPVTERAAGAVRHLFSEITGNINNPEDINRILKVLHPTPAVCGLPRTRAAQFIKRMEGFNRELYTGYIGIKSPGKAHYFVNLRCMKLMDTCADIFVGGGLVKGSVAENEEYETEIKARTMLALLDEKYQ
jgi:isochorismate synthase